MLLFYLTDKILLFLLFAVLMSKSKEYLHSASLVCCLYIILYV